MKTHDDVDMQSLARLGARAYLAEMETRLASIFAAFPEEFASPPAPLLRSLEGNGHATTTRAPGSVVSTGVRFPRRRNGKSPTWVQIAEVLRARPGKRATLKELRDATKRTIAAIANAIHIHPETFEREKPGLYRLK